MVFAQSDVDATVPASGTGYAWTPHRIAAPALRPRPCYLTALTPRELQILQLVDAGLSNREIATTLHLGMNSVKYHLKNVHVKLGAKRRSEAARIGREFGLLQNGFPDASAAAVIVPSGTAGRRPAASQDRSAP